MAIQSISQSLHLDRLSQMEAGAKSTPYEAQQNFSHILKEAIQDVNMKQHESDLLTQKLVHGKDVDLHEVMIAAQKASIALNATMEIRNKIVEAYQEISRMPI